ncbi:MAG: hypothetical protein WBQ34_06535 [Candidatus Acidiferrales bacterium]
MVVLGYPSNRAALVVTWIACGFGAIHLKLQDGAAVSPEGCLRIKLRAENMRDVETISVPSGRVNEMPPEFKPVILALATGTGFSAASGPCTG